MLKIYLFIITNMLTLLFCTMPSMANTWESIEQGLEMGNFTIEKDSNTRIIALRFDPKYFTFSVFSTSKNNDNPQTLLQCIDENNLVAAINASMYLPDGKTSTGYLRINKHLNNKHIAKNFGAFFLSKPYDEGLAPVRLIDRNIQNWDNILEQYHTVIQNFRLIDSDRKILWTAKAGQKHSIAAVAEDGAGNILFLHCRQSIMPHNFAVALLSLPLDVRTVMYVEGGVQAGLALRSGKNEFLWGGWHPSDILVGSVSVPLPNILGVQRKTQ